jgi:hydroxysqualene dehydroxylase
MPPRMKVAVVGAGWAGMAAAVTATQAGHSVTVFEAARTLGGRARALSATLPDGTPVVLDNGQHILIGAYSETLALMNAVGVDVSKSLLRMPLSMQFPDGKGLAMGHLPSPLDALWGMLTLRGWSPHDKWTLVRSSIRWQLNGFRCSADASVALLCDGLTPRVMDTLITPLCVSALNTPPHRASGQVFLTVLRDSLFGGRGSSNLLLPTVDLSRLFPLAAADWLVQQGGVVRPATRVDALHWIATPDPDRVASSRADTPAKLGRWQVQGESFDTVILATPPTVAAQLLDTCASARALHGPNPAAAALAAWARQTQALEFEAIATVYTYAPGARLPRPMVALHSDGSRPAQFVFDRGQLGGTDGLFAFVVSASQDERQVLQDRVLAQGHADLKAFLKDRTLLPLQTVVEKRATFACTPGLRKPPQSVAPGLLACGDYTEGPYPATLEGAVRSGVAAGLAVAGVAGAHPASVGSLRL